MCGFGFRYLERKKSGNEDILGLFHAVMQNWRHFVTKFSSGKLLNGFYVFSS